VRYEERGPSVSAKSRRHRTNRMIRELRSLGYRVEPVIATVWAENFRPCHLGPTARETSWKSLRVKAQWGTRESGEVEHTVEQLRLW